MFSGESQNNAHFTQAKKVPPWRTSKYKRLKMSYNLGGLERPRFSVTVPSLPLGGNQPSLWFDGTAALWS